jgi:hypothetical protein
VLALGAPSLARLAATWSHRAFLEFDAARRFERLAQRMAGIAAHAGLTRIAATAAKEERVHVQLCAEIAERAGGQVVLPTDALGEVAPAVLTDPVDRVLYEVVAFCCVTESSNVSVVTAGYDAIADPAIKKAVRRILADEVRHSRLGWAYLCAHPPTAAQAAWIARDLPAMLAGAASTELFAKHPILGDEALLARHGRLPFAERRLAFETCLGSVCFPGLEAHGVDTGPGRSWLAEMKDPVP